MYLDFYDLQAPPFQLTSDRRFFFAAPQYLDALKDLTPDRAMQKGFRLITGELGAGKSMLCYVMRSELERSNARVAHLVTTKIGPDDLLLMLAAQFGIDRSGGGPGAVLAGIRDFVTHNLEAGKRVVLFIDEAHNLPKPSFKALCSLADIEVEGRSPLEIFLIGQTEFCQALTSRAMKEVRRRIVTAYHLKPLDPGETRGFIVHRLGMAGWRDDPSFSEEAFRTIYRLTEGIPRKINVFCNRLLIDAHLKGLHEIDHGFVLQVVRDSRTEQLPIGGLTFGEDLLSHDEVMSDPDQSPAAAEVAPEPPAQQGLIAGPGPASEPGRPAAAGTWFDRNGARIGNGALSVAAFMVVGLVFFSTAVLFGAFDGSGNRVVAVVKLPPISQIGSDQIEPPEAGPVSPVPDPPAEIVDLVRAERQSDSANRPAKPDSLVTSYALAETKQGVLTKRQDGQGARTAPVRLVPEALAVEQPKPPDSASLDAALPGPEQPAKSNSAVKSRSSAKSNSPAKTRSLGDFVRDRPPVAPLRVAQAPPMTLVDFVLTRAIVDREPVGDVETFAAADGQAFAFARIENPGPSAKVYFVWYRGDQVQANVGLEVKTSARWRTWSAATLKPGSWRVQVLSPDREVLGERLFVVQP